MPPEYHASNTAQKDSCTLVRCHHSYRHWHWCPSQDSTVHCWRSSWHPSTSRKSIHSSSGNNRPSVHKDSAQSCQSCMRAHSRRQGNHHHHHPSLGTTNFEHKYPRGDPCKFGSSIQSETCSIDRDSNRGNHLGWRSCNLDGCHHSNSLYLIQSNPDSTKTWSLDPWVSLTAYTMAAHSDAHSAASWDAQRESMMAPRTVWKRAGCWESRTAWKRAVQIPSIGSSMPRP